MLVAGGAAITMAAPDRLAGVNVLLALLYLPMLLITWKAPEPEVKAAAAANAARGGVAAVRRLSRAPRAIEILAFVVLYKLADNLAQALTRPFLIDMGYNADQRGVALATIGAGGDDRRHVPRRMGDHARRLGHSLWIFGFLQIFSNVGYFLLAAPRAPNRRRCTARRASRAYVRARHRRVLRAAAPPDREALFGDAVRALLEPLRLPRLLAGPSPASPWTPRLVDVLLSTMVIGIPGLLMLARFVPLGAREPTVAVEAPAPPVKRPLAKSQLVARGVAGGVVVGVGTLAIAALLAALEGLRATPPTFDYLAALSTTAFPASIGLWLQFVGILTIAVIGGLFVAAWSAARGRAS